MRRLNDNLMSTINGGELPPLAGIQLQFEKNGTTVTAPVSSLDGVQNAFANITKTHNIANLVVLGSFDGVNYFEIPLDPTLPNAGEEGIY